MVFSSPIFLFVFLPLLLFVYNLSCRFSINLRNWTLLFASFVFYAWGEMEYVCVIIVSIAANHFIACAIGRCSSTAKRKALLLLAVLFNIGSLAFWKYADFIILNLNKLGSVFGLAPLAVLGIHLPLGISFFTFQAFSYVIDVYRGDCPPAKKFNTTALYILLFPQLIAGPIVRYTDVAQAMTSRTSTLDGYSAGLTRFVIGLSKKLLLANPLGEFADYVFGLPGSELTCWITWIGAVSYAFQIYYDFSGYSDMAIGLGKLFGFNFPENFKSPYRAVSVRDFWRRWHITLSTWFRDYVYIPLGGNKHGTLRTAMNLTLVFFLCGLWHGASWNFAVWGIYHGLFLSLERSSGGRAIERAPYVVQRAYTLIVVLIGWIFFRANDLPHALTLLNYMFGFGANSQAGGEYYLKFSNLTLVCLFFAALTIFPLNRWLRLFQNAYQPLEPAAGSLRPVAYSLLGSLLCSALLLLCLMRLAVGTYNPFIYFRF